LDLGLIFNWVLKGWCNYGWTTFFFAGNGRAIARKRGHCGGIPGSAAGHLPECGNMAAIGYSGRY